jgi:poly(3-hydroxybutyrate) depolymerase
MRDYAVDPRRVYVAGLSAGGAAAAIMGDAYPDLFAAIGVHSGLACGAARDMPSAFAAMQGNSARPSAATRWDAQQRIMPAIVFHGDRDRTVNPRNADAIVAQSAQAAALGRHCEQGKTPGGQAYSRTVSTDAVGRPVIEQWVLHGAGHAWSGGFLYRPAWARRLPRDAAFLPRSPSSRVGCLTQFELFLVDMVGIEPLRQIRKGQANLGRLRLDKSNVLPCRTPRGRPH